MQSGFIDSILFLWGGPCENELEDGREEHFSTILRMVCMVKGTSVDKN